jgi:hypothetical protein
LERTGAVRSVTEGCEPPGRIDAEIPAQQFSVSTGVAVETAVDYRCDDRDICPGTTTERERVLHHSLIRTR